MDLIMTYSGGDDQHEEFGDYTDDKHSLTHLNICTAPSTMQLDPVVVRSQAYNSGTSSLNVPVKSMYAPVMGPMRSAAATLPTQSSGRGPIESAILSDITFNEQFQSFQALGFAYDLGTNEILGDSISNSTDVGSTKKRLRSSQVGGRRKVDDVLKTLGESDCGPWAIDSSTEVTRNENVADTSKVEETAPTVSEIEGDAPRAAAGVYIVEPEEEDEKWEKVNERKMSSLLPPRQARGSQAAEATSVFHGTSLTDYQGRTWTTAPSGVRADDGDHECFIPKKCVKKFSGHTKGVQAVEFFPGTGHLLLSGSMDGKCKVWDVMGDRNVRRTYSGHTEGVRSICMSSTGDSFLSSAFDRYIRLWNVETGQAIATFSNRKMGYQVKFSPADENVFLMAASDNKIYQWDVRSGSVVQEYNYHLQPCNSITFFDNGRKFISTSDDKKVLVWEYDIPVPIKYIAEPDMHSIPSVTLHPSGNFFAGQSMDNTIVVYTCGEKVKQLKKRTFSGHNNSGYACQIGFSPNGQFLISGDGQGKLFVWDWKSGKIYRKFQAHENGPAMGAVWHPLLPSMVATCGWDGLIKLWD